MPQDEWPSYRVGDADYLHALGVVASVFNHLEFRFRSLFNLYVSLPTRMAFGLFAKINNQMRSDLASQALDYSEHPQPIKDHVRHFLTGYGICVENRNILMHSVTAFTWLDSNAERCPVLSPKQPDGVKFQKSPRDDPFTINIYSPSLPELRGVADDTKAFEVYGDRLYWHILKNYEPSAYQLYRFPAEAQFALPDTPARPKCLTPQPRDTSIEPI
jgi:hypothetical protein